MKKRVFKLLIVLLLVLTTVQVIRATDSDPNHFNFDKDTGEIIGYLGTDTSLEIPSEIEGTQVTKIAEKAFLGNSSIVSILLPDGLKEIGDSAFQECTSLQTVNIPTSVQEIGQLAFYKSAITGTITIPNGITEIKNGVFRECKKLEKVNLPQSIQTIARTAFYYCSNVEIDFTQVPMLQLIGESAFMKTNATKFVSTDTLQSIGKSAFFGTGLTEIDLSQSMQLQTIPESAFGGCFSLTKAVLPNSILSIQKNAFSGDKLLGTINIPNQLQEFGYGVFINCTALKEITLPQALQKIGDRCFSACENLKLSSDLPSQLEYLGERAFSDCNQIKQLTIPSTVTHIGEGPFAGMTALESVNVDNGNQNYVSVDGVLYNKDMSLLIYFPANKIQDTVKIDSRTSTIGNSAFEVTSGIQTIHIPSNVKKIGEFAFYRSSVQNIIFENGVEEIGNSAFSDSATESARSQLKSIVLPSSLKKIGYGLFYYNKSIETVAIPNNVQALFEANGFVNMFLYSNNLKSIMFMCNDANEAINPLFLETKTQLQAKIPNENNWYRVIPFEKQVNEIRILEGKSTSLSQILTSVQKVYQGKSGQTEAIGIAIPDLYKDKNMKMIGNKNINTKIIDDELYIADGETGDVFLSTIMGDIPIVIDQKEITDIKIKQAPQKVSYIEGETFDASGMILNVSYNNGTKKDLYYDHNDFTVKDDKLKLGDYEFVIDYQGYQLKQAIRVESRFMNQVIDSLNVRVEGRFDRDAYLKVNTLTKIPFSIQKNHVLYQGYDISVVGEYTGALTIVFNVDKSYENQTAYIYHQRHDGTIEMFEKTVKNGQIKIITDELSPFVIAFYQKEDISGNQTIEKPEIHPEESGQSKDLNNQLKDSNEIVNSPVQTQTSDQIVMFPYVIALLFVTGAIFILKKKKQS